VSAGAVDGVHVAVADGKLGEVAVEDLDDGLFELSTILEPLAVEVFEEVDEGDAGHGDSPEAREGGA